MIISLDDLTFDPATPDANGTVWMVTGMDGWDSPGLRQDTQAPSGRHGAVLTESMLDTRPITLKGVAKAQGESQFWTAYNRLLGVTSMLFHPKWLVVNETTPKRIGVVRGGEVRIEFIGVGSFTWEIPLTAPDPVKRATTAKTYTVQPGASQSLSNTGTFTAEPVITTGGAGKFRARHVDLDVVLSTGGVSVASGTVFDFRDRTVTSGSRNRYTDITNESIWWSLQPGTNVVRNNGDAEWAITFRDAWI